MYKLLIVDDEKNIRLGIQAMIKREFSKLIDTMVAADGVEALELIRENSIDILITDIKMPRMDGIALIKELHTSEDKPILFILSGYDDFEYTKAAIKCKVRDYLLKPVNRQELFEALQHTIDELATNRLASHQHLDDFRTSQLNYILLNPNIQEEQVQHICTKININVFPNGFYVGVIEQDRIIKGEDFLQHIRNQITTYRKNDVDDIFCFLDKDGHTVVITGNESIFTFIKDQFKKEKYPSFSIGVSEKRAEIKHLKKSYIEACYAVKYQFLFPKRQVILYKEIKDRKENIAPPIEAINKISNMLGTEREKEIKTLLFAVLDYEKISKYDISYMETIGKKLNTLVFEKSFAKLGEESIENFQLVHKVADIYNFNDFHQYFHAIEDLTMRLHEYIKQVKSVYSEQKYMDKALQYIEDNFHKDLNLAVVSNYISLNYSYFSHVFKEYTGLNFVDYLKKVRIRRAKLLLVDTGEKVYEISKQVGYKNPKQFTRVFREIEGISPKEYREKIK
ncbi:response regulator [Bacillus sp. SM2101]|uniref:response regulator n=1 Tax=Bacillus sp. SM2101 TaxID=2805366 RepID=UPI001BDF12BF|nr:response regulator [Bacillus sp. SM2101]